MGLADKHRLLSSVDVAALVDCGCNVYVWKDGSGAEIEYCPMHEAAPALVEALELIANSGQIEMIRWLIEKTGKSGISNLDTKETLGQAVAKQALAMAEAK